MSEPGALLEYNRGALQERIPFCSQSCIREFADRQGIPLAGTLNPGETPDDGWYQEESSTDDFGLPCEECGYAII